MNLFSKPLDFTRYFNHVVNWNAKARNGQHDFSQEAMDFQLTLVEEEAFGEDELFDGYKKLDKRMVLDGLCDVFVTASYLYFQERRGEISEDIAIAVPAASIDYTNQLNYSLKGLKSGREILKDVCALLYQFDGCVTKALEEVLASNDSKFPKVSVDPQNGEESVCVATEGNPEYYTPEEMCRWIELHSKGRYPTVNYIIVGEGEDRCYIFKSDKGKIVKPATFFEPDLAKFC